MTQVAAITIGSELPPTEFDGVVHSNFDHACNIRLADGQLATCTIADYFEMPRGIRVNTAHGFRFTSFLSKGARACCRSGIVRFGGSDLKIDLRDGAVWRNDFTPTAQPTQHLLNVLWRAALDQVCFGMGFPRQDIQVILAGLGSEPKNVAKSSLWRLIGRGPGLTPAGDDFVAAFLAAPMLIAPTLPSTRVLRNLTRQHLQATNDISRQMLSDAISGLFIEPIFSVMAAIYGDGCFEKSSRNLRSVGDSSGTAMLLGLLAGAAFVENCQLQMTPNSLEPIFSAE